MIFDHAKYVNALKAIEEGTGTYRFDGLDAVKVKYFECINAYGEINGTWESVATTGTKDLIKLTLDSARDSFDNGTSYEKKVVSDCETYTSVYNELKPILTVEFEQDYNKYVKELKNNKLDVAKAVELFKGSLRAGSEKYREMGVELDLGPVNAFTKALKGLNLFTIGDSDKQDMNEKLEAVGVAQTAFIRSVGLAYQRQIVADPQALFSVYVLGCLAFQAITRFEHKVTAEADIKAQLFIRAINDKLGKFMEDAITSSRDVSALKIVLSNEVPRFTVYFDATRGVVNITEMEARRNDAKAKLELMLERYKTFASPEEAKAYSGLENQLSFPKILLVIENVFSAAATGGKWLLGEYLEAYGKETGESLGVPATLQCKPSVEKKFKYESSIPLPSVGAPVITDISFVLNFYLELAAAFEASLELHNFLDPGETKYVTAQVGGKCGITAKLAVGIKITCLSFVEFTGTLDLEATIDSAANASTVLSESNIQSAIGFEFKASAGIDLALTGKLTLNINLTPAVVRIFELLDIEPPKNKFKTTDLEFVKATLGEKLTYTVPFTTGVPVIPLDKLRISTTNGWVVTFPAFQHLKEQFRTAFFGGKTDDSLLEQMQAADRLFKTPPLTDDEISIIKRDYLGEFPAVESDDDDDDDDDDLLFHKI